MQRQKLKELTLHWYKKLEASGFRDIESGPYLKQWDHISFQSKYTPDEFLDKQNYSLAASHFLLTHPFSSTQEKEIWELHAEGNSYREIVTKLREKIAPHSPHCSPHTCELFCTAALTQYETNLVLNKDNVNMVILKLKKIMIRSMGE